jgi:hypothetical protein
MAHCSKRWREAYIDAQALSYQGRSGRLAIVDSPELYDFLRKSFRIPFAAWIGLRYMCSTYDLRWVNGKNQDRTMQIWSRQWMYNPNIHCGTVNLPYMPVWLTPGFQLQAAGYEKGAWYYFVEYPVQVQSTDRRP